MGNIAKFSNLNPVQLYWVNRPNPAGKNQYLINESWFKDQIPSWYQTMNYYQKWQRTDTIYIQVQSNYAPFDWEIVNCKGRVVLSGQFTLIDNVPGSSLFKFFEASIQLAQPELNVKDVLYIIVNAGRDGATVLDQWISEPMKIRDSFPETTALTGTNPKGEYFGMWFDGSRTLTFRCEARLTDYVPGSQSKVYIDQTVNVVQLSRWPYNEWSLTVGHSYGVPNWVMLKLNTLMSCFTFKFEGTQIVASDGAAWEPVRVAQYPMAGFKMTVREANNRFYDYSDTELNDEVMIAYNIDGKVVGTFNNLPSANEVQIIDSE